MNLRSKLSLKLNANNLIAISIIIFTVLYLLPITITWSEIVRKPLLIFGLLLFVVALFCGKKKFLAIYIVACVIALLFFSCSWSTRLSFGSYMFPVFVSLEFYICTLMILEKQIVMPRKTIWFVLIVSLITSLTSIVGLINYPLAVRALGQGGADDNFLQLMQYRSYNIAGWGLLFGISFLEGSALYLYKEKRKLLLLVMAIAGGICVLFSQLAFAILFEALIIFFVLLNGKGQKYIFRLLPFFILFLFLWLERQAVLDLLYDLVQKSQLTILQLRVKNIRDLILFKDSSGDAGTRFELYTKSLSSAINNPLGLFFKNKSDIESAIGFHSEFFDLIGALGILGLISFLFFVFSLKSRLKMVTDTYKKRFILVMFLSFGVMVLINPVLSQPHIWLAALLIPSSIIQERNQ